MSRVVPGWGPRWAASLWSLNSRVFLGFGYSGYPSGNNTNDVWVSNDGGATWDRTDAAVTGVATRHGAAAVVIGGRMFSTGGFTTAMTTAGFYAASTSPTISIGFFQARVAAPIHPPFFPWAVLNYTVPFLTTGLLTPFAIQMTWGSGSAYYVLDGSKGVAITSGLMTPLPIDPAYSHTLRVYADGGVHNFILGFGLPPYGSGSFGDWAPWLADDAFTLGIGGAKYDELRIYDRALSDAEVLRGFRGTWSSKGLQAHYPFAQPTSSSSQQGNLISDQSPNGFDFSNSLLTLEKGTDDFCVPAPVPLNPGASRPCSSTDNGGIITSGDTPGYTFTLSKTVMAYRDFSVCMWYKHDVITALSRFFSMGGSSGVAAHRLDLGFSSPATPPSMLEFDFLGGMTFKGTREPVPRQWQHVCVTVASNTARGTTLPYNVALFQDGVDVRHDATTLLGDYAGTPQIALGGVFAAGLPIKVALDGQAQHSQHSRSSTVCACDHRRCVCACV